MHPYFKSRIHDKMRLGESDYTARLLYPDVYGGDKVVDQKIFTEDEKGNIKIILYDINRRIITYPNPKLDRRQTTTYSDDTDVPYYVVRLNNENLKAKQERYPGERVGKYEFPKGQGVYPFFPPRLLDKFESKAHIETLILTEGYFKAMSASMVGLDIVGLSSITHYADTFTHCLNSGIAQIIHDCNVKNVIILHDGDCLNISSEALHAGEDIAKRPTAFFNAARCTRDLLMEENVDIFYAYVNTRFLAMDENGERPKGLDDLLLQKFYIPQNDIIVKELLNLKYKQGSFFIKMNIKKGCKDLQKHFCLHKVKEFYALHKDIIGLDKFNYYGSIYRYDEDKDEVIREIPKELRDYCRVGDDYYRTIRVPSFVDDSIMEERLVRRMKSTIIDDFGKDAIDKVVRYDAFCNVPEHVNYQPVIHNCLNRYRPLSHKPAEGDFPHIDWMIRHIFGEQYELGMDYMQLLYTRPKQCLPILCLVSAERGTGKTSFLDLLREMYSDNFIQVGNSELQSDFNSFMGGKLVVGVDETSLGDNAKITERIKMLATAKEQILNAKGKDQITIANFTKFVMCSNNETRFIYTDSDEIRFWVRKVPPIPKHELVPNILPFLQDEVDAFMFFLNTRKMSVPKALSRMWFEPESIVTDALRELNLAQRKPDEVEMYRWIREYFYTIKEDSFDITWKLIRECVRFTSRVSDTRLEQILAQTFGKKKYDTIIRNDKPCQIRSIEITQQSLNGEYVKYRDKARFFHFEAKDVLLKNDYEAFAQFLNRQEYE